MKRYRPLFSFVLLGIGIMPPALAQPKISEASAPQRSTAPAQNTISRHPAIADIPRLQDIQIPLTSVEGLYQEALPKSAGGAAIAQAGIAGYGAYAVGQAAQVYLEQGCTWGQLGASTVIQEILNQVEPQTILYRLREELGYPCEYSDNADHPHRRGDNSRSAL